MNMIREYPMLSKTPLLSKTAQIYRGISPGSVPVDLFQLCWVHFLFKPVTNTNVTRYKVHTFTFLHNSYKTVIM